MQRTLLIILFGSLGLITGCSDLTGQFGDNPETLRIATTTSLDDSGLLREILLDFESTENVEVEVVAVGTGQALELGERGDVDVLLVHAPALEEAFLQEGYGVNRTTFMRNQFIVVGPTADPANISSAGNAAIAFDEIARSEADFVSRGDDSGTHFQEQQIWAATDFGEPDSNQDWYYPAGQGMGETLLTAQEIEAYTLTDRATFVTMGDSLPDLASLYGEAENSRVDPLLDNPYSVLEINPERYPDLNHNLARTFVTWLQSEDVSQSIADYGVEKYGSPLFQLIND